jgi:hypothetical protein
MMCVVLFSDVPEMMVIEELALRKYQIAIVVIANPSTPGRMTACGCSTGFG